MSFRIDDILKNKPNSNHKSSEDQKEEMKDLLSGSDKASFSPSASDRSYSDHQSYFEYWNHSYRLASMAATASSLEGVRQNLLPKDQCCSNSMYLQEYRNYYTPTFIYPEKMYSQTNYNHMLPFGLTLCSHLSKRRNQVRFSPSQTKALESKFSWQKYLSPEDRKVKTWFQNRRAKWRRNVSCSSSSSDTNRDITSSAT
ncbi:homeobox protein Hox-A6-like isoform X2 [Sitophilus oryzae]|uniref:Homeobox protein Hox-A6-like isoform X2 n=1 Tax=Sitophilus oryzae TaxID=7048 RepID=A0A6J2XVC8_SITOR|nr:homeobox protein Hox-A6-like isoform X2 [Sitophilus oryzae]